METEQEEQKRQIDETEEPNQDDLANQEDNDLEAWIWILGGIALAVFSILTFIYVHPETPPEGGGQTSEVVRVVIRVALFLCGCALARNGFKLLKK